MNPWRRLDEHGLPGEDEGEEPVVCSMAGCACVTIHYAGCDNLHYCGCHPQKAVVKDLRRRRKERQSKWF
jgi:hypothetical protein